MAKRCLITGITGQDGSYLAELLLGKGYAVYGLVRSSSVTTLPRLAKIQDRLHLLNGDLLDGASLLEAVEDSRPDEIYNLAGQSFVQGSWNQPVLVGEHAGLGVVRLLEAIRRKAPEAHFFQAGSAEMFGAVRETPQTERTSFHPRNPYGAAKVYAHCVTVSFREIYNLFACGGIMFNHESPRRGLEFVTRKITDGAARIKLGLAKEVRLGNLEAQRDWGFAGDYVDAMHRMLTADHPADYVIGTGLSHTVRSFVEAAFAALEMPLTWSGEGLDEVGRAPDGRVVVRLDAKYFRPAEVQLLLADASKARRELSWQPKTTYDQLVTMMVRADYDRLSRGESNEAS